ncbi:MAG: PilZ domain-containing protein [Desulfobacteraceae bacterium]|nr:PilZ domain-containing protein [Desulfobacteraceae bacterium]
MQDEIIRKQAINRYLNGGRITKICTDLDRTTRWFSICHKRYQSGDPNWYRDLSKTPHTKPTKTSREIRDQIVSIRKQLEADPKAKIGANAICAELEKTGINPPAKRTICRILKEYGLVNKKYSSRQTQGKYPAAYAVNHPFENGNLKQLGKLLMGLGGVEGAQIKPEKAEDGSYRNRRRARRFKIKLPVLISGTTIKGKNFTEKTVSKDLSPHGAYLPMTHEVAKNGHLNLQFDTVTSGDGIALSHGIGARVVRHTCESNRKKGVGVAFVI